MDLVRTDSANVDFRRLVTTLDRELLARDGDENAFYSQFNKLEAIAHVLVAYEEGRVAVGCGALKRFSDDAVEVKRMFVPAERRGTGIAAAVLRGLEAWAVELGYARCVLETGKRQPEAIRLYEKSGYGRIPNYGQYAGVDNSVCFGKELARGERMSEDASS